MTAWIDVVTGQTDVYPVYSNQGNLCYEEDDVNCNSLGSTLGGDVQMASDQVAVTAPGTLSAGWHMLAETWDGSTLTLYIDGTPVGSSPQSGTLTLGGTIIGAVYPGSSATDVADVALFGSALSAGQISALYSAG